VKHETLLTSIMFLEGKVSGGEIIGIYTSVCTEPEMLEKMLFGAAQALARMYRDGFLEVTDYQDSRVWSLTEDAQRDWTQEVLVTKPGRPN
jgi:hypothetical protein